MQDIDSIETQEWLEAVASLVENEGSERAQFILEKLNAYANQLGVPVPSGLTTPYLNTIPTDAEAQLPDDNGLITKLLAIIRWNAMVMVLRATKQYPELGGHIATYASAAVLYEIGFHHFF